MRLEILQRLEANDIHAAYLFPGPDGVGQALRHFLELKVEDERRRLVADAEVLYAADPLR
jgi:hypothetical protein